MRALRGRGLERVLSLVSPLILLGLWEAVAQALKEPFLPPVSTVARALAELAGSGELQRDITATLARVAIGFLIGAIPGLVLGLAMGLWSPLRAFVQPLIAATYPIPKIAILPLVMLLFGIGEESKYAIVAIGVFFLVVINSMAGVLNIDRIYLDVARNFGASRAQLFATVALPGALPLVFTGLQLGLGVALLVIVATEFVSAKAGIGFLVWNSWQIFAVDRMYAGLVVIATLGLASQWLLDSLEGWLIPWRGHR